MITLQEPPKKLANLFQVAIHSDPVRQGLDTLADSCGTDVLFIVRISISRSLNDKLAKLAVTNLLLNFY